MYFFSFVKKFLVCFFILSPSYAFTVLVDPGHGGKDPGALSGALKESGINLKVAFFLKDYLKKDPRFKVYLTRESDRYLSLENRVKISQRIKPDIFISLHANSFKDSAFKGAQFYFLNQLPPEKESMYLAFKKSHVLKKKKNQSIKKDDLYFILEDLKKNHQIRYSSYLAKSLSKSWKTPKAPHPFRINQAPFYLLDEISSYSVLIEMGFLSNKKEKALLQKKNYQKQIAFSIYQGLIRFKQKHL